MSLVISGQAAGVVSALTAAAIADPALVSYINSVVASGSIPAWVSQAASKGTAHLRRILRSKSASNSNGSQVRATAPKEKQSKTAVLPFNGVSGLSGPMAKKGKGKGGAPKSKRMLVPRPVGTGTSASVALRGYIPLANTGANVANFAWSVAINTTVAGGNSFGSIFGTALTNWASLYRQYRLGRVVCRFVTGSPNTVSGNMMLGLDPDPLAGNPGSYQSVIRHASSFSAPVFSGGQFIWTPSNHRDKEDKFTAVVGSRDESQLSFGALQMYSANNAASGAALGIIEIDIWVTFSDPC